ncbi:LOW QUALITY PROTEIN: uncharacterized protein LOC111065024 [Drosophila obscura]|uniref:LOW QUALITY PROTEIN: uncharacterized protein LOC111065024 n=1 Tax=Drosophila obscura TaxID=7282 RepID=UPI001BB1B206|nr:LOW QUALITY PROTEIN: uncharacterized protein LOC111065024 [Drosophila obscura]
MRDYPSVPSVFRVASTHSINSESPYNNQQQQQQQQQQEHSPYATLPRGQRFAMPHPYPHAQRQQQQQQQQQQLNTGVINTISGSIPATGFGSDLQLNNLAGSRRPQQHPRQAMPPALGHYKPASPLPPLLPMEQRPRHQQQTRGGVGTSDGQQQQQAHGFSSLSSLANGSYLWLLTPVAASISVAIVIAALAGPQWLFTEEKLPNVNYNGTANFNALDDGAYVTKYTKSSLWILCTTLPGLDVDSYNCIKIDYFPNEGYQPDPHDSTPAIPYTVTKSCPIFLAAGIFLVISFIVFLIPTCSHQNNLFYFSAGILFIVSGTSGCPRLARCLVMLIGLIAYISILKAEIGSKLRPRSTLQPALFKVTYGQSFFLFVFGFIVTEFVGVLNIFLFINLQEISYYGVGMRSGRSWLCLEPSSHFPCSLQRLPCFSVANIHAKIKEGTAAAAKQQQQHALSHSYKRYKQPGAQQQQQQQQQTGSQDTLNQSHPPANHQQQQQQQQQQSHESYQPQVQRTLRGITAGAGAGGRQHQVHDAARNPGQTQTLPGGYACRKHPNAASNLNLYLHNDLDHQRRFYFEKPAVSKCNLHSRSFAKSLNELSGPTPVALTLPAPALFADLPQEFPLTRSVSTTTDIYSTPPTAAAAAAAAAPNTGQLKRKQQRNMATNTHHSSQSRPQEEDQSRLCGLKRGLRKTKDELFQEFCRRAGVLGRAKPKNIYYISGGEEEQEQQTDTETAVRPVRPVRAMRQDDDDADGDDHGFRQFRAGGGMDEDQLYVVGDHAQLVGPRRASMCPLADGASLGHPLRKLNSNLSLHNETAWPGAAFASGQLRLAPPEQAQSRTLPRCFLRQSAATAAASGISFSANASASQQRFNHLLMQHQQQLQQQNRYLSTLTLPRPAEEQQQQQQQLPPKSVVQWPAAIPSSPSNYGHGGYQQHPQPLYPATSSGPGAAAATSGAHPPKFQRGYAFDDAQRRASFAVSDAAFDLDEIERERRRSHASLFGQNLDPYDLIHGTAV